MRGGSTSRRATTTPSLLPSTQVSRRTSHARTRCGCSLRLRRTCGVLRSTNFAIHSLAAHPPRPRPPPRSRSIHRDLPEIAIQASGRSRWGVLRGRVPLQLSLSTSVDRVKFVVYGFEAGVVLPPQVWHRTRRSVRGRRSTSCCASASPHAERFGGERRRSRREGRSDVDTRRNKRRKRDAEASHSPDPCQARNQWRIERSTKPNVRKRGKGGTEKRSAT